MPPTSNDARSSKDPSAKRPTAQGKKPRTKKTVSVASDDELRLTGDRLVVRTPDNGERKTAGGLLIPATAMPAPKRLAWGDVQLVGPDVRVARRGDRVLFLPSAGLEVELDGEDYVLLRERDVQAVSSPAAAKDHSPGQYL